MPIIKHPLTGGIYSLQDDGLINVTEEGKEGIFSADGAYLSGELKHADIHLLGWLGGKQSDPSANRHAAGLLDDE
jgi:hypothetical protein